MKWFEKLYLKYASDEITNEDLDEEPEPHVAINPPEFSGIEDVIIPRDIPIGYIKDPAWQELQNLRKTYQNEQIAKLESENQSVKSLEELINLLEIATEESKTVPPPKKKASIKDLISKFYDQSNKF